MTEAFLTPVKAGVLPDSPYVNPTPAFTTQALGHLVVLDPKPRAVQHLGRT